VEQPGTGGKLQLAQHRDGDGTIAMGSLWKLYVDTDDCRGLHDAAVAAGHRSILAPMALDRWPVTIAFVADPDGYSVELVERTT
jgi:lactoylglutathione lyase